jgi:pilus assembly protein CpaB
MVDLDSNFQTILPNSSSSILAPGPGLVLSLAEPQETGPDQISTQVTVNELIQTLTAQVVTGGAVSPVGRLELDQSLGQPFYVVPSESKQRPRLVSQTLIQNVIVLQIGNFLLDGQTIAAATPPPEGEEAPTDGTEQQAATTTTQEVPDSVTLVVSPQDAVTLNFLLVNPGARLSLALRSAGDDSQAPTEAVTLQFLLDQYSIPVPAKLPFGLEPRLDLIVPPVLLNDIPPATEGQQ